MLTACSGAGIGDDAGSSEDRFTNLEFEGSSLNDVSIEANGVHYYKFTYPSSADSVAVTLWNVSSYADLAFTLYSDSDLQTAIGSEVNDYGTGVGEDEYYYQMLSAGTNYLVVREKAGAASTYSLVVSENSVP